MEKLYFSINKDSEKKLCGVKLHSKSKTEAKNQLRDQGLIPKIILTWDDIEKIKKNEFNHNDFTEDLRQYALSQADLWEQSK